MAWSGRAALAGTDDEVIQSFTGGADITDGGVALVIETKIDDGHSVPIDVSAQGAAAIGLYALLNPNKELTVFSFGSLAGASAMSTRIRLAATQDVIAIARMRDGSYRRATKFVASAQGGYNI